MSARDRQVLLCQLCQRTSKRGTEWLSGLLGEARVIGFRGEPKPDGTLTWNLYVMPRAEHRKMPVADGPCFDDFDDTDGGGEQ